VVVAEAGLPAPRPQARISDADGVIARVDLLFEEQRTILEVDGKLKYVDPDDDQVLWREKKREDRLREAGYEVVRVTWADLMYHPERVRARLLAAFARAQRRWAR
jgi:very-short-patch-repair endonuclease